MTGAAPVYAQDAAAKTTQDGVYTAEQADRGATVVGDSCALCHGNALRGSPAGPTIMSTFQDHWGNQPVSALYDFISTNMPADNPGGLAPGDYADVVARILMLSGAPAGDTELPADEAALSQITVVAPTP